MPKAIQSIERASAILRLLSGRTRRMSLTELAGELRLPKGTVYGIVRTLVSVGFVEQEPESGKYHMGAALLHLGSTYLDGNELRARALNWSDWLAGRTNESVRLGTMHDGQVLVVHHVFRPDNSPQALEVGALLPVHATAMGKVLLAHHAYLLAGFSSNGGLARFTDSTVTDLGQLDIELERIRAQGWGQMWKSSSAGRRPAPPRFTIDAASQSDQSQSPGRLKGSVQAPSRAAIWCPTSARARARSHVTLARSPGSRRRPFPDLPQVSATLRASRRTMSGSISCERTKALASGA